MTDPTEISFSTRSGLRLAATRWNGGGTGVILAHGGGQTRHAWRGTGAELGAQGYTVLAFDLRGHGESEWASDGDYSLSRFRDDLCDVATTFARPPIVIGASLGGISAMLAAGEALMALRAVVLVDVTPRIDQAGSDKIVAFMREHMERGFGSVEEAADIVAAYLPDRQKPANPEGLRKYLRQTADGRFRWHWDPQIMIEPNSVTTARLQYDRLMQAVRQMTMPALLVRGGHSDVVSPEAVKEFLAAAPQAQYQNLAGAHHMVVGDRNDAFTATILDFLVAEAAAA
jgi:pimeloyl-ACP methyl ester carboxylesterase